MGKVFPENRLEMKKFGQMRRTYGTHPLTSVAACGNLSDTKAHTIFKFNEKKINKSHYILQYKVLKYGILEYLRFLFDINI